MANIFPIILFDFFRSIILRRTKDLTNGLRCYCYSLVRLFSRNRMLVLGSPSIMERDDFCRPLRLRRFPPPQNPADMEKTENSDKEIDPSSDFICANFSKQACRLSRLSYMRIKTSLEATASLIFAPAGIFANTGARC